MSDERVRIVAAGYDRMAERFLDWAQRVEGDPRLDWLADLAERLPDGARVLELGCGAGEPCTRILSERFRVTGVDSSAEQLRLAARNAPEAELVHADFLEAGLPADSFDAVCSFEQAGLAILRDEVVTFVEPDHGDASFQWILAER